MRRVAPQHRDRNVTTDYCDVTSPKVFMAALCNRGPLYFCPVISNFYLSIFFFFYSSPNLSGRRLDVYHTLTHSANLERRSERCCTRLAANAGPKKVAKNRHLGTIPQVCWAISSQLRHISTIGKKLVKHQHFHMSS